jgi:lipopolysaccharide transport system ATP-binding protein
MSDVILKVENLSKQYRLGTVGTGTISHDFNRWWHAIRGKEDPYLKIGESNDRATKGESEYVWALKDINFEVKRGEVLGIIGKNGAGKSTLLKILSKVTGPTIGSIKSNGRIASLLEVGTGFHPEMTGRENVYLNGAILGMTKKEIVGKIDEIIEFSGCERYIDTPVKRYSSGMKVRLAFAVAAHLEPDILIVDEVLAVGDAEFQKKAIGKMQDISAEGGRTVLFVSHDMSSINRLCQKSLLLKNGYVEFVGETSEVIKYYLLDNSEGYKTKVKPVNKNKDIELLKIQLLDENNNSLNGVHEVQKSFVINIKINIKKEIKKPLLSFHLKNSNDEFVLFSDINDSTKNRLPKTPGIYNYNVKIEQPLLKPDRYFLYIGIVNKDNDQTNHFSKVLNFELKDFKNVRSKRAGYIYKNLCWDEY